MDEMDARVKSQLENSSVWPIDRRTFIEWNLQLGRVKDKVLSLKNEGNKAYADKDYDEALDIYYEAMAEIAVVTPRPCFTEKLLSILADEDDAWSSILSIEDSGRRTRYQGG